MGFFTAAPGPSVRITGWGKHLPARIVDNFELEQSLPTTNEWIVTRTGIEERRIAAADETPASLGLLAARQALQRAGIAPEAVELIIVATSSPQQIMPATAALIQQGLGCPQLAAFDINAACSGGLYAMAVAAQFIRSGMYRTALVVGAEVYSRQLDWSDRSTCILFGDGAGAVVLQAGDEPGGILSMVLGNDASGADYITCSRAMVGLQQPEGAGYLAMNGGAVFKSGVRMMAESSREAIVQAGLAPEDIDLFIPHQANLRIISAVATHLGVPQAKVFTNVARYGNTAAASVPIALCEAADSGLLLPGQHVAMVAAGSGMSFAAMVATWAP